MKCCLVFAGGGTKGAALAGGLGAFSPGQNGIDVIGYGGCSVGSIIAVLGAAGYRDQESLERVIGTLSLDMILGDQDGRLQEFNRHISTLKSGGPLQKIFSIRSLKKMFRGAVGLFEHDHLKNELRTLITNKVVSLNGSQRITFREFEKATGVQLRIIATDLTARSNAECINNHENPAILPDNTSRIKVYSGRCTPDDCVLDAVAASCSFPVIFKPVIRDDGSVLIDGGVVSNAPVFLFQDLNKRGIRTYLMDLVNPPPQDPPSKDPASYAAAIWESLGSSDELVRQASPLYEYFPIRFDTPEGAFDPDADANGLYNFGAAKISALMRECETLPFLPARDDEILNSLIERYGPPGPYESLMSAFNIMLADILAINVEDIRSSIYVPSNHKIYPIYFDGWPDGTECGVGFESGEGPVGKSWSGEGMIVFRHQDLRENHSKWDLSKINKGQISDKHETGVAIPVYPVDMVSRNDKSAGVGQAGEAAAVILLESRSGDNNFAKDDFFQNEALVKEIEGLTSIVYSIIFHSLWTRGLSAGNQQ